MGLLLNDLLCSVCRYITNRAVEVPCCHQVLSLCSKHLSFFIFLTSCQYLQPGLPVDSCCLLLGLGDDLRRLFADDPTRSGTQLSHTSYHAVEDFQMALTLWRRGRSWQKLTPLLPLE